MVFSHLAFFRRKSLIFSQKYFFIPEITPIFAISKMKQCRTQPRVCTFIKVYSI